MLKNKKKLNSIAIIIHNYMDELCFKGAVVISDEKEFVKQTKFFLNEAVNYNIETLLCLKEDIDGAIEELEEFEKLLH